MQISTRVGVVQAMVASPSSSVSCQDARSVRSSFFGPAPESLRRTRPPAQACYHAPQHQDFAISKHPEMLPQVDLALLELFRTLRHGHLAAVEDHDVVGDVEHELRALLDQNDGEAACL